MMASTPEESVFNRLCQMEAEATKLMENAIQAGHYQLAFVSLRSLITFINIAKEAALDVAVEKEDVWPPNPY